MEDTTSTSPAISLERNLYEVRKKLTLENTEWTKERQLLQQKIQHLEERVKDYQERELRLKSSQTLLLQQFGVQDALQEEKHTHKLLRSLTQEIKLLRASRDNMTTDGLTPHARSECPDAIDELPVHLEETDRGPLNLPGVAPTADQIKRPPGQEQIAGVRSASVSKSARVARDSQFVQGRPRVESTGNCQGSFVYCRGPSRNIGQRSEKTLSPGKRSISSRMNCDSTSQLEEDGLNIAGGARYQVFSGTKSKTKVPGLNLMNPPIQVSKLKQPLNGKYKLAGWKDPKYESGNPHHIIFGNELTRKLLESRKPQGKRGSLFVGPSRLSILSEEPDKKHPVKHVTSRINTQTYQSSRASHLRREELMQSEIYRPRHTEGNLQNGISDLILAKLREQSNSPTRNTAGQYPRIKSATSLKPDQFFQRSSFNQNKDRISIVPQQSASQAGISQQSRIIIEPSEEVFGTKVHSRQPYSQNLKDVVRSEEQLHESPVYSSQISINKGTGNNGVRNTESTRNGTQAFYCSEGDKRGSTMTRGTITAASAQIDFGKYKDFCREAREAETDLSRTLPFTRATPNRTEGSKLCSTPGEFQKHVPGVSPTTSPDSRAIELHVPPSDGGFEAAREKIRKIMMAEGAQPSTAYYPPQDEELSCHQYFRGSTDRLTPDRLITSTTEQALDKMSPRVRHSDKSGMAPKISGRKLNSQSILTFLKAPLATQPPTKPPSVRSARGLQAVMSDAEWLKAIRQSRKNVPRTEETLQALALGSKLNVSKSEILTILRLHKQLQTRVKLLEAKFRDDNSKAFGV